MNHGILPPLSLYEAENKGDINLNQIDQWLTIITVTKGVCQVKKDVRHFHCCCPQHQHC